MKLAVFLFFWCKSREVFSLTLSFASASHFILHARVTKLVREFQPNQPDAPNSHNILWSPHVEPWKICSVPIKPNWSWNTKQMINKTQRKGGNIWHLSRDNPLTLLLTFSFLLLAPNVSLTTWVFMQYLILWTCMVKANFVAYS